MTNGGFTTVSIATPLIKRIDSIFQDLGFTTRASFIDYYLRKAVEENNNQSKKVDEER